MIAVKRAMKDTFACAAIDSNEMGPCSHFVLVPNYSTYNHRLRAPASDSYQYISNESVSLVRVRAHARVLEICVTGTCTCTCTCTCIGNMKTHS